MADESRTGVGRVHRGRPPGRGRRRTPARFAAICCSWGRSAARRCAQHASTIRAVLVEVSRNPALNDAMQHQFLDQRKALIEHVLRQAVDRGEIDAAAVTDDLWDVLPGYLIFRSISPARPPTRRTVQALVDEVIMPSLTIPGCDAVVRAGPRREYIRVRSCAVRSRTVLSKLVIRLATYRRLRVQCVARSIERLTGAGVFDRSPGDGDGGWCSSRWWSSRVAGFACTACTASSARTTTRRPTAAVERDRSVQPQARRARGLRRAGHGGDHQLPGRQRPTAARRRRDAAVVVTITTTEPAVFVNVVAQGDGDSIGCRITVDGRRQGRKNGQQRERLHLLPGQVRMSNDQAVRGRSRCRAAIRRLSVPIAAVLAGPRRAHERLRAAAGDRRRSAQRGAELARIRRRCRRSSASARCSTSSTPTARR